jgi:hypothetical protein
VLWVTWKKRGINLHEQTKGIIQINPPQMASLELKLGKPIVIKSKETNSTKDGKKVWKTGKRKGNGVELEFKKKATALSTKLLLGALNFYYGSHKIDFQF